MGRVAPVAKSRRSQKKPLQQGYRINQQYQDQAKKNRKEDNKNKALGIFKKRTDIEVGLPNIAKFKNKLINSLERQKQTSEKLIKINQLKQKNLNSNGDIDLMNAHSKSDEYENNVVEESKNSEFGFNDSDIMVSGNKKYFKELNKVLQAADIIIEVLDARDPLVCRSKDLEAQILGMPGNQQIILVLNKIDLVPPGNAEAWLKFLRREFATVLFKANTQNQDTNLSSTTLFKKSLVGREDISSDMLNSSKAVGAENLLQLIKNYSQHEGVKTAVTVGVIGYPNVGKSSVINSLKRTQACGVSSKAGFTRSLQEVQIDSMVKILDCPGVVFDEDQGSTLLRNIVRVEDLEDPIEPVNKILEQVQHHELMLEYKIGHFSSPTQFLVNIAQTRGKLLKGGAPDLIQASQIVLHDWNTGKIKFFTIPPQIIQTENEGQMEITN